MSKGIATVVEISPDGTRVKFTVKVGDVTDELVIYPRDPEDHVLGLEHLQGCQVGDDFFVTAETIPPRTSTLTHIVVSAIKGPARERSIKAQSHDDWAEDGPAPGHP